MVTEQYVSFETARLLKEKGFPQHITSHTYFVGDDKKRGCVVGEFIGHPSIETDIHLIDAPTQQMALRWLREVKNIHINIYWLSIRKQYHSEIIEGERGSDENCNTYEDAVEYALKYCLTKLL